MIYKEFIHLLRTAETFEEIDARRDEIAEMLPSCAIMLDYPQDHPYHPYDLWEHSVRTVVEMPGDRKDDVLYLGAFLHDIGKPGARREADPNDLSVMYRGHPEAGVEYTVKYVLPELPACGCELTEEETERLLFYIRHHDDCIWREVDEVKELVKDMDPETACNLMYIEIGDGLTHLQAPLMVKRIEVCREVIRWLEGQAAGGPEN